MRKLLLTTAAVAAAIAGAVAGETAFGTFTDTRDGQTYKTVKMPDGKTWMAQNLNYKTKSGSWCYYDSLSYCKKYGRLYNWKTAKTVCPNGWKLPSNQEWDSLVTMAHGLSGRKLKSKSGWHDECERHENGNGTDNYGFSALPGGGRISAGVFYSAGDYGYWWTATEDSGVLAYGRGMNYEIDYVDEHSFNPSYGFSVRCVADNP